MKLTVGEKYKWKHEPQILCYVGVKNDWHRFKLVGTGILWCECLDSDIQHMEHVK